MWMWRIIYLFTCLLIYLLQNRTQSTNIKYSIVKVIHIKQKKRKLKLKLPVHRPCTALAVEW